VYRRYTLDEVKRKIVDVLQGAGGMGLSGIELAEKTRINRMTVTKYLDVMNAMGLVKKKKIGPVNVWVLESGVGDIEFPVNYVQVQQKLIAMILAGEEDQARKLLLSVLNSNVDTVKVLTEVLVPAANTVTELYSRGRLGKTERAFLSGLLLELVDIVKFNSRPADQKPNAHALFVAGSEDRALLAKSAAVAFQVQGWNVTYVGSVEGAIDPFFDIDFQRYTSRVWGNKRGLMMVCIFSTGEGSLRFLVSASRTLKGRLKGELRIAIFAPAELQLAAEEGHDYSAKDVSSLVEWAEREYLITAK
jgi:DNA-binding MarR family transcriptional regulator